jgi:hypothetical protein
LVKLKPESKAPEGLQWNLPSNYATAIDPKATGYGLPLKANGLCSIDPDNVDRAVLGLNALGFDLNTIMSKGVRTISTRPGSGGRSAFADPGGLRWLKFRTKASGIILELRADSPNLQDTVPGLRYVTRDGEVCTQHYANSLTLDDAKHCDLPDDLLAWWQRMSADPAYYLEQQFAFADAIGERANADYSTSKELPFKSDHRMAYNAHHDMVELLEAHGYEQDGYTGRYRAPGASGSAGVRLIPDKVGLWESSHGSDPLHGTFDAWVVYVRREHDDDLSAAEAAWYARSGELIVAEFDTLPEDCAALPALERYENGNAKPTRNNLLVMLRRPDLTGIELAFDNFKGCIVLSENKGPWVEFADAHYTELALCLEREYRFGSIGRDTLRDLVHYVAQAHGVDTAQSWLDTLKWDGTRRLERVLPTYFGAEDSPYTRAIGLYLFTALAGRIITPGVKADMVPTAVGAQGLLKSSTVAAISPISEAFLELDLSEKEADLSRKMRGRLVVEMGELVGMRKKEVEAFKQWIVRREETWTPKFKEYTVRYARRCVFFATTNSNQFLTDDTGNRRWLPFITGTCDPKAMERDRDQLWAEGAELYRREGVVFQAAEELAREVHADFVEEDSWLDAIDNWLNQPPAVMSKGDESRAPLEVGRTTIAEVLGGAIGLSVKDQNSANQKKAQKVLRTLRWKPSAIRPWAVIDGKKQRARFWIAPGRTESDVLP